MKQAAATPSFVDAIYGGVFGDKNDGVYPGRTGKNSIQEIKIPAARRTGRPRRHALAGCR